MRVSPLRAVRTAFGWLTVFPVGAEDTTPDRTLGAAVIAAVPIVGAVLGALVALSGMALAHTGIPALLAGVLAVALLALTTRGMHLDGLADTADGLGCYGPPSRVTEVMRSGTVGPFGVATLVLVLGIQGVGFGALFDQSRWYDAAFAVALGRVGVLVAARRGLAPAHPDGFGALVAGTQRTALVVWAALALAAAAVCGFDVSTGVFDLPAAVTAMLVVLVVAVVVWLFTAHCARRMGGITGDVLGATIELGTAITVVGLLA